jgi:TonB family protein
MIKAAFYLAAFYLVYTLLLSRDTMYRRNRVFILFSVFSALLLPFITIQTSKPINFPIFGKMLSDVMVTGKSGEIISGISGVGVSDWNRILLNIYITGLLITGGKLIFDLIELAILIVRKRNSGTHLIRFNWLNTSGFSAMGYIFINSKLSSEEAEEILKHEQNHLDHNHFSDIIFIEIVKVFQWFNPFVHLFDRALRATHEYQADEGCINRGISIASYQQLLMNQVFKSKIFNITNSFSNPTLIKKRMIMMTKKRSGMLANLKILMVLPVIAIVMIAFSSCGGKNKPAASSTEIAPPPPPPPPASATTESEPLVQVQVMPVFQGGDSALVNFIARNTSYPENAKSKGIQGRVIVKFAIDTDGSIKKVSVLKGVDSELDKEAVRVVSLLPKFEKPGYQDGKPVAVWYNLPITFTLK